MPGKHYFTAFPLTEDPISEGGRWNNQGAATGGWTVVQTTPGLAFSTNTLGGTADSYAYLTGFGNDYQITATTFRDPSVVDGQDFENELHIRMTDNATNVFTYEFLTSPSVGGAGYQFVKWEGPNGSFTDLTSNVTDSGLAHGTPQNGDVYSIRVQGKNVIAWVNRQKMFTYVLGSGALETSSPYTTGNPGLGFDLTAGLTTSLYGWSNIEVTAITPPSFRAASHRPAPFTPGIGR